MSCGNLRRLIVSVCSSPGRCAVRNKDSAIKLRTVGLGRRVHPEKSDKQCNTSGDRWSNTIDNLRINLVSSVQISCGSRYEVFSR